MVVVISLVAGGMVGAIGPATAQAQSGNGTENATEGGADDTAFDDPSTIGNNTSAKDPALVGNNTSINDSSSFVNTNVTYKAPANVTGNGSGNNTLNASAPPGANNSSAGATYSCGGDLLGSLMSGDLNMTCRLKKWIFGTLFGGFMGFIQGIWNTIVEGIFHTPAPMVDGDPAIFAEPTNTPWKTLWNVSMFTMIPAGLIIWAFIFLCSLGITSLLPLGPQGEYKKRQMNNKAVLAFFGIIGSWGIGSTFLWLTKGATAAIMPAGSQIASDGSMMLANNQGAIILVAVAYLTGGTLVAYFALLIIFRFFMAGIFMIALPVLIPLVMVDVGPLEYVSSSIERFVDVTIMFIIMVIPMGLVLQGGYAIINGLNQGSGAKAATVSTILTTSGMNGVLVFVLWILTGLVPLFMYRQLGQVKGIASGAMAAGRRASDRLKELSSDPSDVDNGPDYGPGSMRPDDILEGSDIQRSSDTGEFGGALGNGKAGTELGQSEPAGMLGRGSGTLGDPRDPNASSTPNRLDEGHPAASALAGGDGGQQPGSGGRWSQFTDRVGNVGGWAGDARSNLNDRINNAREMGDTVRDNGGGFVAGAAGATAGFFGGASEESSGSADQNTTRSDVGSRTTSASNDTASETTNQNTRRNVDRQPNNSGGSY
ncbi:hypothetical protein [Halococcus thailandensis]|uniref:hypothetical protein n=1 Tax=Halococcus thailandensis TaxID=335952 RepID=UPI000A955208|nr:hypothetical protein [Halococcus thailandensis]